MEHLAKLEVNVHIRGKEYVEDVFFLYLEECGANIKPLKEMNIVRLIYLDGGEEIEEGILVTGDGAVYTYEVKPTTEVIDGVVYEHTLTGNRIILTES